MTKNSAIQDKSFAFAISVVNLCKGLVANDKEFVISKQLLRSGTAVGALIREAEHAESKKDFVHKLSIALKEANETVYWLDLLYETDYIKEPIYTKANAASKELVKLLVTIIKSSKKNL